MGFLTNEDGSTAVEQAVMRTLILVCITAINTFTYVSTEVGNVGT
jgi:Flp pilus assembly pilin Flp